MSTLPAILVAGAHDFEAEEIIRLIIEKEIVNKTELVNGVSFYGWRISNKYYSADVNLCSINTIVPLKNEFKKIVEAFMIFFDINKENCLTELDKWLNCIKDCSISEQILVCKSTKGLNDVRKDSVDDWCIKNRFELVELEQDEENTESNSFFKECTGIDRVVEILHAHEWPNLTLNGETSNNNTHLNVEEDFEELKALSSNLNELSVEKNDKPKHENKNDTQIDDEDELENMEQLAVLFKNLQSMKNEISSLGANQKLEQAEKVVKAFWNAIGGDAAEFSDSEDDLNNCA